MKYSAKISIALNNETRERLTDDDNINNYFKGLFIKKRSVVIEESFSAVDVLSKLNASFKNLGVTNLVRISHDDTDFYLDIENELNDLDEAINEFNDILITSFERFYEEILVVMETTNDEINFVIELLLLRVHQVGEYPIQINFSGLPTKTGIVDVEDKFKLFVSKVEQNISKFLSLSDITVSFTKKSDKNNGSYIQYVDNEDSVDLTKSVGKSRNCDFFPLYGIKLGETPVKELAKKGTRAKDLDDDKKPYKYYTVNDVKIWHNRKTATHMYITYTSPIPEKWRKCGLDWSLSYNQWRELFKKLGFFISDVKVPKKEWYRGKRTLVAEFHATKKISDDIQLVFDLDFNYSQKTSKSTKGTIYSISVRAE